MRRRSLTGTRRRSAARLFAAYAVASLIPVVGLGAVLAHDAQQSGTDRGLAQGRAQAAVIVQMAVAPALGDNTLGSSLSRAEIDNLQHATDLAIYSGSLTALRLRSFTGTVLFSDDGSRQDTLGAGDAAFREAARGGTSVAVTAGPNGDGQSIRVLQPVVPTATGEATGVLELYLPYGPIAAVVRHETRQTYLRLGAGLVVLYFVLGAIAWSTTRRLRRYAEHQTYQAQHDPLTGLPNRSAFRLFAEETIAGERGGALVLVDLNRFKEVNDVLGHHAGDELLVCVAERLLDSVRTDDHVTRLGGDEFGILLSGVTDRDAIMEVLDAVHRKLAEDVEVGGIVLTIEACFGVAIFPEHGTDLEQLLKDADAAMYQGKRSVRPTVIFEPGTAPVPQRSHEVQVELQRALELDELVLHYQPKINLVSGVTVGMEALVRWNHPTRGFLPPSEFVPVAEASSLIGRFTEWVLRRGLTDMQAWRARGETWTVAVNVSAHNLEAPDFVRTVIDLIRECGADPRNLVLELTETALASDSGTMHRNITALSKIGVRVSVDDFGAGSTGLLQLRGLAIGELKLDRAFVSELAENESDQNLARAVVQLAHGMNCAVVAEGVEDDQAADYLRSVGCDLVQGFLYQRPAPWQQMAARPGVDDGAAEPADTTDRSMEVVS